MRYESPAIVDFGSIADHTFLTPGGSDKDPAQPELDKFGEGSHGLYEEP